MFPVLEDKRLSHLDLQFIHLPVGRVLSHSEGKTRLSAHHYSLKPSVTNKVWLYVSAAYPLGPPVHDVPEGQV